MDPNSLDNPRDSFPSIPFDETLTEPFLPSLTQPEVMPPELRDPNDPPADSSSPPDAPPEAEGDPDLGVLRLSFTHYTTRAEVDHLITALDEVL